MPVVSGSRLIAGRRRLELLAVSEHGCETADVCLLLGQDECDPLSGAPGAAGPADAVDVALAVLRRVVVDHVADRVEVEASGCDVGGDERRHLAAAEALERPLART